MLKEGMYVEFYEYDAEGELVRKIGQFQSEKKDQAQILYHEWNRNRMLSHPVSCSVSSLRRAEIRKGTIGLIDRTFVTIIRKSRKITKDGYRLYYCASDNRNGSFLMAENHLKVQFDALSVSTKDLFLDEIFADADRYFCRQNIKKYVSKADIAPEEYESVIGKRVELLEHQIETIKTITRETPIRAILADEVGLGKTIEALMALDFSLRNGICKRALIIVPDQLRYQWCHEAVNKFGLDAAVFLYHEFLKGKAKHEICIISDADFKHYYQDFNWDLWDFVICDEVHRAIRDDSLYAVLLKMCRATTNLLLLSATPLLQKGDEMYRLLRLYNPSYYTALGLPAFKRIIQARKDVIECIDNVNYGFEMSPDLAHAVKCLYAFKDIATKYEDVLLQHLLSSINENDEDNAVDGVKTVLNYLDKRYEITPKYVRHRRSDILDPSSKRCLNKELEFYFDSYDISGEVQMYQTMREEIENGINNNTIATEDIMALGEAFFSSASAMNSVMISRNLYDKLPKTYKHSNKIQQDEINSLSNSRLETLVNYLNQATELRAKKTVIFTDFYETAMLLKKRLSKEFGNKSVALFSSGQERILSHIANNSFRNVKECNFLICDKSGVEGKNLQFADYIIHYDLPWIPTDIEQRIGRLDRIGRKPNRPVNNIVIYSRDTIEEDLFSMCNDDLNIFEESLSGIEIVFDQITELIKNSIRENALLGFDIVGDDIKELKQKCEETVQQEEFEQMCFQAENGYADRTQEIIDTLTGDVYKSYVESLCAYHSDNGYDVEQNEDEIYLEGISEKGLESVSGTFSIEEALREEELAFLSVSNPLINAISQDAINNNLIKTTAIRLFDTGIRWCGFIATWEMELFIREFYHETWEDAFEKTPNTYVDDSIMILSDTFSNEDFPTDYLYDKFADACKEGRYELLDGTDIEDEIECSDLSAEIEASIKRMRSSFKELVGYKFDQERLQKDIESAKRDYKVSRVLKNDVQNSKSRVEALVATKRAMKDVKGRLDSLAFVVFEE